MNKKVLTPAIIFILVTIIGITILASNTKTPPEVAEVAAKTSGIILFYGDGCPHCALVEEYVNQNGIETKVPFVKKEVYYNKQNANELAEQAKICGMPIDSIGVPFLWDGSRCLVGDQPIIDFFKQKVNEQ